jgi:hypothetical protein
MAGKLILAELLQLGLLYARHYVLSCGLSIAEARIYFKISSVMTCPECGIVAFCYNAALVE